MSTNVRTEPSSSTPAFPKPARRIGTRVAATVAGIAAAGSVALLLTAGADSTTGPSPAPAPRQSTVVLPAPPLSPSTEVFAGCLNDIECNGEPSSLPATYWNPPIVTSVD